MWCSVKGWMPVNPRVNWVYTRTEIEETEVSPISGSVLLGHLLGCEGLEIVITV
jgi:hypothetical protein